MTLVDYSYEQTPDYDDAGSSQSHQKRCFDGLDEEWSSIEMDLVS